MSPIDCRMLAHPMSLSTAKISSRFGAATRCLADMPPASAQRRKGGPSVTCGSGTVRRERTGDNQ
jgi:hypothetical protein